MTKIPYYKFCYGVWILAGYITEEKLTK